jgi:AraC-like ligand binding domain
MWETLAGVGAQGLERSCNQRRDSIRFGTGAPGLERLEVSLSTCAFEPHRHDTYAIGITTAGVQTFRYRGTRRVCLPGQLHVLHPDETHDGAAGTTDGFGYRILYLAPELVRDALDGGALPFVADPVQEPTPTTRLVASLLADLDDPISDLAQAEIAATLADTLRSLSGRPDRPPIRIDLRAVQLARHYLAAHAGEQTPASTLEQVTGAPPGAGPSRDRERPAARPGRRPGWLRRPKPHDAAVQADLRHDAGPLAGPYSRLFARNVGQPGAATPADSRVEPLGRHGPVTRVDGLDR